MQAGSEVRSRYLSLALKTREVIDSLISFLENEKPEKDLKASLSGIVDSLKNVSSTARVSSLRARRPFIYHEQIATLEEVKNSRNAQDIAEKLEGALQPGINLRRQKKAAEEALDFFCALEARALLHYRQGLGSRG